MTRDNTTPFYERIQTQLPDTEQAKWIKAAINFLQLTSQKKMFGWDKDRELQAVQSLSELSVEALSKAYDELKSLCRTQLCDFGDYYRLANANAQRGKAQRPESFRPESDPNDWRDIELQRYMQPHIQNAPKSGNKAIKNYWMAHVKCDLQKADGDLTKSLPYDKNHRY